MDTVRVEGGRFLLNFTWDQEIIRAISAVPGRRISPDLNGWTAPLSQAGLIRDIAHRHSFRATGRARILFELTPTPAGVQWNGNGFELRFDYMDQRTAAAAAHAGGHWFGPAGCWLAPESAALQVEAWAAAADAGTDPGTDEAFRRAHHIRDRVDASSAGDTDWHPEKPLGIQLYPEQRAGVDYVIRVAGGRAIIGDEPGVGKTAQAMAVLNEMGAFPAYIIVPGSLKMNWDTELQRALPGRTVERLYTRKAQDRLDWADITVINYEILNAWEPYLPDPAGVVADESHLIKNPVIERTKATIRLMHRVPAGGAALCLSGTPVLNDPEEIITQLDAIGQLQAMGGRKLRATYAGRPMALNHDLRKTCYVRRLKKDVWKEAPERRWIPVYVEGDPRIMAEYRRAEADIIKWLRERAQKAALKAGATTGEAAERAWRAGIRAEAAQYLVAITHLKQLAAKAKTAAAVDYARTFLSSGTEKLAVYAWHTEIVNTLHTKLGGVKIQGGMTDRAKDTAVNAFQHDKDTRVFTGQIATAGLGLTLTAASKAMILEQGWTPGIMDQVLDRHHRRGQEHDVVGWLMLIQDTIDTEIYELIREKRKIVDQVTDGFERSPEDDGGGTVLQDLLLKLVEKSGKILPDQEEQNPIT